MYPVVFFDALRVTLRDEATVLSNAIYLALAVLPDGTRDRLGRWSEQTEGAKVWMKVFTDLKTRGCQDILIAVTDGLTGMSAALAAVYPATTLQTCIVHLLRHSLDFATGTERKPLAAARRPIYTAVSHVIPFFAFPRDMRRVLDTTNALERVHAQLRKIIKTRSHFPNG